jgi:hypothetical protein
MKNMTGLTLKGLRMTNFTQKIGFTYFTSPKFQINRHAKHWLSFLRKIGASTVIFESDSNTAIPEDLFIISGEQGLEPIVHLTAELPVARKFNEISFILDVYAKWGVKSIILGDQPNTKKAWPSAGWHYENLVDHFLDRFIPLANHVVKQDMLPVLSPLMPGGDYWDTAFVESILNGLRQRRMDVILEKLILSSYGFTFNKPLTWGSGGPQRWPLSKPYMSTEGQEDQLGLHNYEWIQAIGERATGKKMEVMILDAGVPGMVYSKIQPEKILSAIRTIQKACKGKDSEKDIPSIDFDETVHSVNFDLETFAEIYGKTLSIEKIEKIFIDNTPQIENDSKEPDSKKTISHYLLLPSHTSGVSDAVLNKVRPVIKKFHPTVGFSLQEAAHARKVSVFPDPLLFGEEAINELRSAGCTVEILPETGIDIATILQ